MEFEWVTSRVRPGVYSRKEGKTGREFLIKLHPVTAYWHVYEKSRLIDFKNGPGFNTKADAYRALEKMFEGKPSGETSPEKDFRTKQIAKYPSMNREKPPTFVVDVIFRKVDTNLWVGYVDLVVFEIWRDEEGWWYGKEQNCKQNFATRMATRKEVEAELQVWLDDK